MQLAEQQRVGGWTVAAGAVLWAAVLVAAPYLAHASGATGVLYAVGSLICHQQPERSFHLAGAQLPVCGRCLGVYLGGAAGAVLWMVWSRQRARGMSRERALTLLAIAALPTGVTVAGAIAGLADPSNAWRAALALPLGFAGGRLVAAMATNHLK